MSVREIASGLLIDLGCVPDTDENAALIEAAIREAAKPLVEALEELLADCGDYTDGCGCCMNETVERSQAGAAGIAILAAWRDGK